MRFGSVANLRAIEGRTVRAVRFLTFEREPWIVLELAPRDVPHAGPSEVKIRVVDADGFDPFDRILVGVGRPGDAVLDVDVADAGAVVSEVSPA